MCLEGIAIVNYVAHDRPDFSENGQADHWHRGASEEGHQVLVLSPQRHADGSPREGG